MVLAIATMCGVRITADMPTRESLLSLRLFFVLYCFLTLSHSHSVFIFLSFSLTLYFSFFLYSGARVRFYVGSRLGTYTDLP